MTTPATWMRSRAAGVAALAAAALLAPIGTASAAPATATVVGTLTGPDGEVLARVAVLAGSSRAFTTAAGKYTITGVTPGTVRLHAEPDDQYRGGTAASGYVAGYSDYFTATAGSTTTVDLQLPHGAALGGRVLDDRTGSPVVGARMELYSTYEDTAGTVHTLYGPTVSTKADGVWWVRGLDPSRPWKVYATAQGRSTDAPLGSSGGERSGLSLTAGSVTKGISFRLVPLTEIDVSDTAPENSGPVNVVAGDPGSGGVSHSGTWYTPSLLLSPQARYGASGDSGPVCASGTSTTASPLGLAEQCIEVPFSATQRSEVSFAMTVGGAITGALTDGSTVNEIWVDWNGRRIDGAWNGTSYTLGNLPAGTYIVHATSSNNLSGDSAQVQVVQGKVTKHVDITLS